MLKTIVQDYKIVADIPAPTHAFNGESSGAKDMLKHVYADRAAPRTVLDIGFGIGDLARVLKEDPSTAHWQVDGIDGFYETCENRPLFEKGWYRNVWHGLAQEIPAEQLASYDLLCLFDVIEHLDADGAKALLKSLLEALGPQGRLALSTPLWFYPQAHNRDDDLEEHLIGVPARSLLALKPLMYVVDPVTLVGSFIFSKDSLALVEHFQPTADRGFNINKGMAELYQLGGQADGRLYVPSYPAGAEPGVIEAKKADPRYVPPNTPKPDQELLDMMPAGCRAIVELGSGSGELARVVRGMQPQARFIGIETDAELAEYAAAHCDELLQADVELLDDAAFARLATADCWIFSESLARLRDPWKLLRRLRAHAHLDSCLLVSLPNAQHWSVIQKLLSGALRPEVNGLLDRRLLHLFTRTTSVEMFQQTGWQIEQGFGRTPVDPMIPEMEDVLKHAAKALGLKEESILRDGRSSQFLFKLRPA